VDDAFLYSSSPDSNYGTTAYMSSIEHYVAKFHLPSELLGMRILDAQVGFYGWNQSGYTEGEYLELYRVTHCWAENEVTWNHADNTHGWTAPGGDYETFLGQTPFSGSGDHDFFPAIDITYLVQEWADATLENCGVLLLNDSALSTGLKASEYNDGHRTYLEISYTSKPSCPGDMNRDGDVDGTDLAVFLEAYENSNLNADLSNNGQVNNDDCALFTECMGRSDCL
jgi:hypothetical protein